MFNRESFNRGKFNVSSGNQQVSGRVILSLKAPYAVGNMIMTAPRSTANIVIQAMGRQTSEIYAVASASVLELDATGTGTRLLYAPEASADISIDTEAQPSVGTFAPVSEAEITIETDGESTRWIYAVPANAPVAIKVEGQGARAIFAESKPVQIVIRSNGEPARKFFAKSPASNISVDARGSAEIYGYSVISLPGLVLPPGGEITIDTGEMTVTMNGVDVTRFFSADSEFFRLKPGDNLVIYKDGVVNRNIYYIIMWKDLFL